MKHHLRYAVIVNSLLLISNAFSSNKENLYTIPMTQNVSHITKGYGTIIEGDFIYWTARQDGLQFAYSSLVHPSVTLTTDSTLPEGSYLYPDWSFDPGFKAGIGIDFDHDGWDVLLKYTHLTSSASELDSFSPTQNATSLIGFNLSAATSTIDHYLQSAKDLWSLHLNTFDLELGRDYFLHKFFSTRLFFGFKGTWQKQKFNNYYTVLSLPSITTLNSTIDQKVHQIQKMNGVGIRMGMQNQWIISKNWGIFGDFALTALWCHFKESADAFENAFTSSLGSVTFNYQNLSLAQATKQFNSVKGILELCMGIRYDISFLQDRLRLRIDAGWEEQVWFDQNQFIPLSNSIMNQQGDLILQGLTLKFRFDF